MLTLRITLVPEPIAVIECHDRLCAEVDPVTGEPCSGSGDHLGVHMVGAHLRINGKRHTWPNRRVHRLVDYRAAALGVTRDASRRVPR